MCPKITLLIGSKLATGLVTFIPSVINTPKRQIVNMGVLRQLRIVCLSVLLQILIVSE